MSRPIVTCHPEREHYALGLCRKCYYANLHKKNYKPSKRKPRQMATCHPTEPLVGHGLCKVCYMNWYVQQPHIKEKYATWNKRYADRLKRIGFPRHVKEIYNITQEQFQQMKVEQNGHCKICGVAFDSKSHRMCVDHNHTTGKVRALLCTKCNLGLGHFEDNPNLLLKALEYLLVFDTQQKELK